MVYFLYIIQLIICACLIALVITSDKEEGLSSAIGGGGGGGGRFKPGYEERMDTMTKYFAIAFMVVSLAIASLVGN